MILHSITYWHNIMPHDNAALQRQERHLIDAPMKDVHLGIANDPLNDAARLSGKR
jgi:hypothetical protein